jgi:4'-phosphopantetheinyl transferase
MMRAPVCHHVELDSELTLEQMLSGEERERADRFRFEIDRRRFMAAHVALRRVLAEHTGLQPHALCLVAGRYGKPSLVDQPGVQFSLSHSQTLALIAVGTRGPLGADIELLRPVPDAAVLAERHFTRRENAALAALPARERERAFLVCWTRKEACLKAIGLGLLVPPESFEVGLVPELRSVELRVAGRLLWLVVGPAPARLDSVGSLAEWRGTNRLTSHLIGTDADAATAFQPMTEVCA